MRNRVIQVIRLTLIEELEIIKKKIDLRDWILGELKRFESKYGISTTDFTEKWKLKKIPEPDDYKILEEFLEWDGLSESLDKVDRELEALEKHIKES